MESNKKNLSFRLLVLITNQKLAGKAVKLFRAAAISAAWYGNGVKRYDGYFGTWKYR